MFWWQVIGDSQSAIGYGRSLDVEGGVRAAGFCMAGELSAMMNIEQVDKFKAF